MNDTGAFPPGEDSDRSAVAPTGYLIVDSHQDLAYNVLEHGRDYTRSVEETRSLEQGTETPSRNGDTLLGWPEFQKGRVALVFATLFAAPARLRAGEWETQVYRTAEQAHELYRRQLDVYHRLTDDHPEKFRLVHGRADLDAVLAHWAESRHETHPVGLVPIIEGGEGVREPAELEFWWERGVRFVGLAWAGTRFSGGTNEPGPLTREGHALLEVMGDLGLGLDVSHMDEPAVLEALDTYPGTIIASHSNARALVEGTESNRQLTDRMIRGLLERDAVIGVVPANGFLRADWRQRGGRESVSLDDAVAQIDYVCQVAGDARHVGLGSDYDGGFGVQSVPPEVDTIADLQKLPPRLLARGYAPEDVAAIMGRNWLSVLRQVLPEAS